MFAGEGVPRDAGKIIGVFTAHAVPLTAVLQVTVALPLASVDTSDTLTIAFPEE